MSNNDWMEYKQLVLKMIDDIEKLENKAVKNEKDILVLKTQVFAVASVISVVVTLIAQVVSFNL